MPDIEMDSGHSPASQSRSRAASPSESSDDELFEPDIEVQSAYDVRMAQLFPDQYRPAPAPAAPSQDGQADESDDDAEDGDDAAGRKPLTKKEKQAAKRRRQRGKQRIAQAEAEELEARQAEAQKRVLNAEPVRESGHVLSLPL